jgi:hypothetical protein
MSQELGLTSPFEANAPGSIEYSADTREREAAAV